MFDEIKSLLTERAPLSIGRIEFDGVFPIFVGPDWVLAVICPWVLRENAEVVADWETPTAARITTLALGDRVVGFDLRDPTVPADPMFVLESGRILEIYSDTDLDPWTLRLGEDVFVGPLVPVNKA